LFLAEWFFWLLVWLLVGLPVCWFVKVSMKSAPVPCGTLTTSKQEMAAGVAMNAPQRAQQSECIKVVVSKRKVLLLSATPTGFQDSEPGVGVAEYGAVTWAGHRYRRLS
jgi:hypothetical protein